MNSLRWYFSTWFIALLFCFWFLIIPIFIGCLLIVKQKKTLNTFEDQIITRFKTEFIEKEKHLAREIKQFNNNQLKEKKKMLQLTLLDQIKSILFQKKLEDESYKKINEKEKNLEERINQFYLDQMKQKEFLNQKIEQQNKILKILNEELPFIERRLHRKQHQINRLNLVKEHLRSKVIVLKDDILYQSFGFYDLRFDLDNSTEYKIQLEKIRKKQKEAIKDNLATNHSSNWRLDNSHRKGDSMNKKNIMMTIRSFNNECDAAILKVKFNNIEALEKKIRTSREQLNKLNRLNIVEITDYYLDLKLEELYLAYEFIKKKQEEKEEQRRIKELMREERRAQEELEEKLKVIQKEEQHFKNALSKYHQQLLKANKKMRYEILMEIKKTNLQLNELQVIKEQIDYRITHAKAGYVYVISNLGSFGEDVYKIGMTRRLEPMDRVKELGDASVPFSFDVHAMIFSEDAPALENSLHKFFHDRRVNKVNNRKEFFKVTLDEIEKVIRSNHKAVFEVTKLATAQDYRETIMIEREHNSIFEKDLVN